MRLLSRIAESYLEDIIGKYLDGYQGNLDLGVITSLNHTKFLIVDRESRTQGFQAEIGHLPDLETPFLVGAQQHQQGDNKCTPCKHREFASRDRT
jgi:hypothetical protein